MTIFDDLSQLRLHYLAENLDNFVAKAKSASMPYEAFVHRMAELELVERSRRGIERRLKESKIGRFAPIQDFDWNWPKEVSREQIESLFTKEFLESRQNLILAGP